MLNNRIVETGFEFFGACVKVFDLLKREVIKLGFVTARKVREDGGYVHGFLMRQTIKEPRHVFFVKTKTVHARVNLDMDGYILSPLASAAAMTVLSD